MNIKLSEEMALRISASGLPIKQQVKKLTVLEGISILKKKMTPIIFIQLILTELTILIVLTALNSPAPSRARKITLILRLKQVKRISINII